MFPEWFYWIVLFITPIGLIIDMYDARKYAEQGNWVATGFNLFMAVIAVIAFGTAYIKLGF